jgi:glycosyltransferase involved in cell wall biosynthesis
MNATTLIPEDPAAAEPRWLPGRPQVDVVIPVYNEERVLRLSTLRLCRYFADRLSWLDLRVTIADNASTDNTPAIAMELSRDLPGVAYLRLEEKGRGRALRAAWSASTADVVAYMDVDLSTDLRCLGPLLEPLISGDADLAIGSRLAQGAEVTRGLKREFISRSYNRLLGVALGASFSDAQCGFKAGRRSTIAALLPSVQDEAWFFDTELLYRAQCEGLRIHEVPVHWIDDPDSRVDILSTALEDLRGVHRLRAGRPGERGAQQLAQASSVAAGR